jgi:predicted FMN-binding regulatory protein PaiB
MPTEKGMKQVPAGKLKKIKGLPKMTQQRFQLGKTVKVLPAAQLNSTAKKWMMSRQPPKMAEAKERKIKGLRLKAKDVERLRRVSESDAPTQEIVATQKLRPDDIMGVLYSSIVAFEYNKLQGERKLRERQAKTPTAKAKLAKEWSAIVSAMGKSYAAVGVKSVTEKDLNAFAKELTRNAANFNAIAKIANTAEEGKSVAKLTKVQGGFLTQHLTLPDLELEKIVIPHFCDGPLVEGKFTKHFSKSFALKVKLWVPCPKWSNPFRWCKKTFTLAGVSFNASVEVGYRINCCGGVAWGQAHVEVCGTIVGIKVCASCTATISAVVGIGRTGGSGGQCVYGLGFTASLVCKLAGITLLNASVPFGWSVSGPCPPAILPC